MLTKTNRNYNHMLLAGCGGLIGVFFFLAAFVLLFALGRDREFARYPGALSIASHSNYTGLPFQYRWDDAYLVEGNFTAVYQWYSTTFNLGAESRANGDCIYLDGESGQFLMKRYTIVQVCATPQGQMVFVTRMTAVNR